MGPFNYSFKNGGEIGITMNVNDLIKELSKINEEFLQKNEDKEFTIKLVTPFGKAKVCSWKAASVNDAVKEFLDANPAYRENKKGTVIAESLQKNEDFKNPKTHDEIKPGEWYEVEGTLYQIADRQPIDSEIQAFKVLSDYSVGKGVHALYKSLFKPDKFNFVGKKDKITKMIKEKEAQIAKLKQEIDTLKSLE